MIKRIFASIFIAIGLMEKIPGGITGNGSGTGLGDVPDHPMRDGNTRKKQRAVSRDRLQRHRTGHGRYHRRTYLCGKPSTRHV